MMIDIPENMKAWVLDDPENLRMIEKPVPQPGTAEVLVRIDAVAICATDLEVISHGYPALIEGGPPFNKNFTPGHEYMGTIAKLGSDVDEYDVGDRVAVEIHAGCGRCERCRMGMYTSCLNYGKNYPGADKGHRANGFTTDGGFAQYAINNVNTLVKLPDFISNEEGTLAVTAGTAMYALDVIGGLIAGESVVVIGAGPIGLMVVAVAKSLGAEPVMLVDIRDDRLDIGQKMGADILINAKNEEPVTAVKRLHKSSGVNFVLECSGAKTALNDALNMVNRGGRICLAAFPQEPVLVDTSKFAMENIYLFGIRGEGNSAVRRAVALINQRRFDVKPIHSHTFPFDKLTTALKYARERIDGALKVVVNTHEFDG
ncbi:zinc-binding dehydrogenase [Pseudomonadota bacterium]